MGLSENKRKSKLSNDPNNTNWTRDTSSFGHKILLSQGWTPGDYLGAKDAAHAEYHSAANASHIRVVLKDDNLGLGAKKGSGQGPGECTGLDAFTSLLGRLNSDDQDAYVQEEMRRADLKKAIYTEQRWGSMRFVKGGFLVGDKVVEIAEAEAERVRGLGKPGSEGDDQSSEEGSEAEKKRRKKEKKLRKQAAEAEIPSKKEKSKKDKKPRNEGEESPSTEETEAERKLRKKEKKEKKRKAEEETSSSTTKKRKSAEDSSKSSKKRRKQNSTPEESDPTENTARKHKSKKCSETASKEEPDEVIEKVVLKSGGPTVLQGRHAVRARNIAQKRMASMDATALNQIFMVKG